MTSGLLRYRRCKLSNVLRVALLLALFMSPAYAQEKKPNILMIMSDDVGISNISAYSDQRR